jgi:hypothetical protein
MPVYCRGKNDLHLGNIWFTDPRQPNIFGRQRRNDIYASTADPGRG